MEMKSNLIHILYCASAIWLVNVVNQHKMLIELLNKQISWHLHIAQHEDDGQFGPCTVPSEIKCDTAAVLQV